IIRRAAEAGKPPLDFAQFFIDAFLGDMRALNVEPAAHYPKVTQHIAEIVALVQRLVDRGYAYPIDGEVYFRTKKAKHSFGILSLEREKMSKSLGNFVTIREVLRDYPGEVVRLCLLKSHYRENVEYDEAGLGRSRVEWAAMCAAIAAARDAHGSGTGGTVSGLVSRTEAAFRKAMDDDLDTEGAVDALRQMTEAVGALDGISADEGRAIVNVYR